MGEYLMAIVFRANDSNLHCQGVTLVELVITMVIASLATAAIIMAFRSQNVSSLTQEAATMMQQNTMAAMDSMTHELRMAGYDPTGSDTPGFITASSSLIRFTADLNGDGDVNDANEDISYGFKTSSPSDDTDMNGIANDPPGVADLRRDTGGGMMSMAENIEAFNFAYAYDFDGDGILDTSAGGNTIWAFHSGGVWFNLDINDDGFIDATDGPGVGNSGSITGVSTGTSFNINDVRAIKIWILARSNRQDATYNNTNTYVVGRQVITPNDKFYRRLLTTIVTCRNLGL